MTPIRLSEALIVEVRSECERLYGIYNKREYVDPDPLMFLYPYADVREREVVALIASSLAYGRVAHIKKSVSDAILRMHKPLDFVTNASEGEIIESFRDFRHRFTDGMELAHLIIKVKEVMREFGSLEECFYVCMHNSGGILEEALSPFAARLRGSEVGKNSLLPAPGRGSACKRLNLFLRWMVRRDEVDPGGWNAISPASLIIPLDTHMRRITKQMGFTNRRQADMKTAIEATGGFRLISPEDPVKYDFAVTRPPIRGEEGGKKVAVK